MSNASKVLENIRASRDHAAIVSQVTELAREDLGPDASEAAVSGYVIGFLASTLADKNRLAE